MMEKAVVAQKAPFQVDVVAGKSYFWCACGRSAKQPFCDGSHKGSEFSPVKFTVTSKAPLALCGCKHTGNKPFCDGTHNSLK